MSSTGSSGVGSNESALSAPADRRRQAQLALMRARRDLWLRGIEAPPPNVDHRRLRHEAVLQTVNMLEGRRRPPTSPPNTPLPAAPKDTQCKTKN